MTIYIVYFHEKGETEDRFMKVEDVSIKNIKKRFKIEYPYIIITRVKLYTRGLKCQ